MMRSSLLLFLLLASGAFSQSKLSKDSFYVQGSSLPENYKVLVEDPKGWRVIGRFNCYTGKIEKVGDSRDTLHKYTSFENQGMYSRIKGNKIIAKGDLREEIKIIYVNSNTLITEHKRIRKIKGKDKLVKVRTRYRRVT